MFVYMSERETRPQLARRWFNYGFNDYVSGECRGSLIDYKMRLEREKASDSRGLWIQHWAEYGFSCAILYFEVLDGEGGYNAFRHNPAFNDLLSLDFNKEPPLNPDLIEGWPDSIDGWQLIRADKGKGRFETLAKRKIHQPLGEEEREAMEYLIKNVDPADSEFIGICYWM